MKEPLVLLPGMMCDARLFAPQIEAFSAERLVTCDALVGADNFRDLAAKVLADAPPRFALAGLSMGGICAMEMIRQAPERITRLALLDTNALPDPAELAPIRESQAARSLDGHLVSVMRDEMKPNYLADGPNRQAILDICMDMATTLGPQVFADQSEAIKNRPDQRETLKTVKVPTLVLMGEDDRLCPLDRHTLMHKLIEGSELAVIEDAGHLPTLEQPEKTTNVMNAWLNR
ncbi:MAG: alpha/beta hydrolase [Pseudomonadota bacterium]